MIKQRMMPLLLAMAICVNASSLSAKDNTWSGAFNNSACGILCLLLSYFIGQHIWYDVVKKHMHSLSIQDTALSALTTNNLLHSEKVANEGTIHIRYSDAEMEKVGFSKELRFFTEKKRNPNQDAMWILEKKK